MAGFRDLRIWSAAVTLAQQVYAATSGFPESERWGLTSQMRRAAVSVAANIAEGQARGYAKEFLRHLAIARASLAELATELEIAAGVGFVSTQAASRLEADIGALTRQIQATRTALRPAAAHARGQPATNNQ